MAEGDLPWVKSRAGKVGSHALLSFIESIPGIGSHDSKWIGLSRQCHSEREAQPYEGFPWLRIASKAPRSVVKCHTPQGGWPSRVDGAGDAELHWREPIRLRRWRPARQ